MSFKDGCLRMFINLWVLQHSCFNKYLAKWNTILLKNSGYKDRMHGVLYLFSPTQRTMYFNKLNKINKRKKIWTPHRYLELIRLKVCFISGEAHMCNCDTTKKAYKTNTTLYKFVRRAKLVTEEQSMILWNASINLI